MCPERDSTSPEPASAVCCIKTALPGFQSRETGMEMEYEDFGSCQSMTCVSLERFFALDADVSVPSLPPMSFSRFCLAESCEAQEMSWRLSVA